MRSKKVKIIQHTYTTYYNLSSSVNVYITDPRGFKNERSYSWLTYDRFMGLLQWIPRHRFGSGESTAVHYNDVIMSTTASQIASLTMVYSSVYSGADQRKHQSSASQAFVWGIHRWPVNSPHKWPVTRKMFPFDDVIMYTRSRSYFRARFLVILTKCLRHVSSDEIDF